MADKKPTYRLSVKQKQALDLFYSKKGSVTKTMQAISVSRQTHYNWLEHNPKYAERFKEIDEELDDYTEAKLFANIEKGDQRAIEFRLKKSNRGYNDSVNHKHTGPQGGPIEHTEVTRKQIEEAQKKLNGKL